MIAIAPSRSVSTVVDAFLSRSRIETYQACPRLGYYQYSFGGLGLSLDPGAVYYDTGNAVHAGLAECLRWIQRGLNAPTGDAVHSAIEATNKDFDKRSGTGGLERLGPHIMRLELDYRDEQRTLSAALVYAWIVEEWESFAQRYEILAIELDTHFVSSYDGVRINWESKADAIVRERMAPHSISVWSWKTATDTREWTRRKYRSDLQGYLETWFAAKHTGLVIDYNQVVYLVKGKKLRFGAGGVELPWNADISEIVRYATDSFLLAPYFKPDDVAPPFFNEIEGILPNTIWSPSYRRQGNVSDSYYRGWRRPDYWRLSDLDTDGYPFLFRWIESLKNNSVFPTFDFLGGDPMPLSRIVVHEEPTTRDERLTEELLEEITHATARYAKAFGPWEFPRNLRTCTEGPPNVEGNKGCAYQAICKGPGEILPLSEPRLITLSRDGYEIEPPAGYVWRVPHHVKEFEALRPLEG